MWKYWWKESTNIYHLSQGQDIKQLIMLISEGLGMFFFSSNLMVLRSFLLWLIWAAHIVSRTAFQYFRVDWNDGPSHRNVWPMVDNHRKPSNKMVRGPKKHRKTIDHDGCAQPFHSMAMVALKTIKICDGKISHICQIRLLTANF